LAASRMTRARRIAWNQPVVVGGITASIAAIATVAAALISSSGGSSPPTSSAARAAALANQSSPSIAIIAETWRPGPTGEEVAVNGVARSIPSGDVIYATAKPRSASQWFVSSATVPDTSGRWTADVVVTPPQVVTVQATYLPWAGGPAPPGFKDKRPAQSTGTSTSLPFTDDPNQDILAGRGPASARGRASKPILVPPPVSR
jgi:hypothetical protein